MLSFYRSFARQGTRPMTDPRTPDANPLRFGPRDVQEDGVKAFLVAADALWRSGEDAQAELKLRQALRQAELIYGCNHVGVAVVLSIMVKFYKALDRFGEAAELEARINEIAELAEAKPAPEPQPSTLREQLLSKQRDSGQLPKRPRVLPIKVRQSCQLLGLNPDDLSIENVNRAWKEQMKAPSVHPDLGGQTETAILLNQAKELLVEWVEEQTPKLGKHFDNFVR